MVRSTAITFFFILRSHASLAEQDAVVVRGRKANKPSSLSKEAILPAEKTREAPGIYLPAQNPLEEDWSNLSFQGLGGRQLRFKIGSKALSEREKETLDLTLGSKQLESVVVDQSYGLLGDGGMGGEIIFKEVAPKDGGQVSVRTDSRGLRQFDISLNKIQTSHNQLNLEGRFKKKEENNRAYFLRFGRSLEGLGSLNIEALDDFSNLRGPFQQNWQEVSQNQRQYSVLLKPSVGGEDNASFKFTVQLGKTQFQFTDVRGTVSGFPTKYQAKEDHVQVDGMWTQISESALTELSFQARQTMFDDTKETQKSRLQGELALVFKFDQNWLLAPEFGLSRSETSDQLAGNSAFVTLVSSTRNLEQRVTASAGFRFPSLEEKYIDSGLIRSNTNLETEKSSAVSWTCSLKWKPCKCIFRCLRERIAILFNMSSCRDLEVRPRILRRQKIRESTSKESGTRTNICLLRQHLVLIVTPMQKQKVRPTGKKSLSFQACAVFLN